MENRTWRTRFRGTILIHAAQRVEARVMRELRPVLEKYGRADYEPVTGAIIGMVDIVDCVTRHRSGWFTGPAGHAVLAARRDRGMGR